MKLIFLFVAAACIGLSFEQPPPVRRCFESPDAWSGSFFMVDYSQGKSDRGYMFYNRTELRIHYSIELRAGKLDYIRLWMDFKNGMAYTLDENTRVCTRDPIPFDDYFPLFGAPRDADFRHHDTLGSFNYNLGVRTDYFRMDTENGGVFHGYYAPVYDENDRMCVPVIESYENIDTAPTLQKNTHFTFMNITTDHINDLVWEIPGECFH